MSYSIGLGLALNVLFWLGAVTAVCLLEIFVIDELFPGRYARKPRHARIHRSLRHGDRPVHRRNGSSAPPGTA